MFVLNQLWNVFCSLLWPWAVYGFLVLKWINAKWAREFLETQVTKEKSNCEYEKRRRENAEQRGEYLDRKVRELEEPRNRENDWNTKRIKELEQQVTLLKRGQEFDQGAPRTALGSLLGLSRRRQGGK